VIFGIFRLIDSRAVIERNRFPRPCSVRLARIPLGTELAGVHERASRSFAGAKDFAIVTTRTRRSAARIRKLTRLRVPALRHCSASLTTERGKNDQINKPNGLPLALVSVRRLTRNDNEAGPVIRISKQSQKAHTAIHTAETLDFDVIMLDLIMPGTGKARCDETTPAAA